jgi:hypothetical protein
LVLRWSRRRRTEAKDRGGSHTHTMAVAAPVLALEEPAQLLRVSMRTVVANGQLHSRVHTDRAHLDLDGNSEAGSAPYSCHECLLHCNGIRREEADRHGPCL